jgi:hypothetical protein
MIRAIMEHQQPKFDWVEILGIFLLLLSWLAIGYMIVQIYLK